MSRSRIKPIIETETFDGRIYRHPKAYNVRWSSYYGQTGGGFGSLAWSEDRPVSRDYPDIGFRYRTKVRKGLRTILFDGFIVKIEPVQSDTKDHFQITALGWSTVFNDDAFNKIYADARPAEWVGFETPVDYGGNAFTPDKFDYDKNGRIYFKPRRGIDFVAYDWTALRYTFPFGEGAAWISLDYDLALPYSWPGKLSIRDGSSELWSKSDTGTGSVTLTSTPGATRFDVRFYVTAAGENTAVDDTVYAKLTDVRVGSLADTTVTITEVAEDLVAYLTDHGLDDDVSQIDTINRALPQTVAFENDWTPQQIMEWCAQFGGEDNALLAWGVELNDRKRLYLEEQDLNTVKYYVRRTSGLAAQVQGDLSASQQKTYVVYRNDDGEVVRTDDVEDADQTAKLGGYYRREPYQVSGTVDADTAADLADLVLAEHSAPQVTTSFTVTDHVYSATGKRIPIEEIKAGGIVVVADFRGREATQDQNDYRTQWTSFQLVGVEIDYDNNSARLIPAGDRRTFEQFLARLASY